MIINRVKKITDFRFLNLFCAEYRDKNDRDKQWIFASRSTRDNPIDNQPETPDAVVIVPFHQRRKELVLVKEFRVSLGGYQYGFPAGLIDRGESIEQAGERELFEETGLTIVRVIKKSPPVFSSSGLTDESVSLLFVECDGNPTDEYNRASEEIEVVFLSIPAAKKILNDETIKMDVKTWIVVDGFIAQSHFGSRKV